MAAPMPTPLPRRWRCVALRCRPASRRSTRCCLRVSRRAAALPSEVEDAVAHADGLQALEALRWRERLSRAAASAAAALAAKERDLRRREAEREATSAQRLLARAELLEAAAVKRAAATAATASHTLLAERAARTHALLRASFTAGGLSATLLPLQQSPPPPLPLPPPQVVGGPLLDTLTGSKADWARVSGSAYSLLGRADLTTASAVIAACDTARHAAAALRKAAALARETDPAFAAVQAAQVRSSERAAVDKTRAAARVAVAVAVAVPEPPHFRSSEDIWASPA